jgi:hypothetical protein
MRAGSAGSGGRGNPVARIQNSEYLRGAVNTSVTLQVQYIGNTRRKKGYSLFSVI